MGTFVLPVTQKAIIAGPKGEFIISDTVPVVELEPDAVIIKTSMVALNPVDTKMFGDFVTPGAIFGFDCAGTVVAVGSNVTQRLAPGDRVCGSADGMDRLQPCGGAFAEYASLLADMTLKIPDFVLDENATALGTALAFGMYGVVLFSRPLTITAGRASNRAIPSSCLRGKHVNRNNGDSTYKIVPDSISCGLDPITTCSPSKFDLVKSYGATAAFDYNSKTCGEDIRRHTKGCLAYVMDCITLEQSIKICYAAIGRAGGRYTALDPYPEASATRRVVKPDWILATAITGRGCTWPAPYGREGIPALREFGRPIFRTLQRLLDAGKIKSHPPRLSEGGFEEVVKGINVIRRGEVRGEKLVYRV